MSSTTATRQRRFWLASSFLVPIVSLGISGAQAQQTPSEQLPPIEVTSPTDPNRTRAKPTYDEARPRAASCRAARRPARPTRSGDRPGALARPAAAARRQFTASSARIAP
jgi:iron complex outermembrane receptor protein